MREQLTWAGSTTPVSSFLVSLWLTVTVVLFSWFSRARENTSMGASLWAMESLRGLHPKKAATLDFLPGLTALMLILGWLEWVAVNWTSPPA